MHATSRWSVALVIALSSACGGAEEAPAPEVVFEPQRPEFVRIAATIHASSNELLSRALTARMKMALEGSALVGQDLQRMRTAYAARLLLDGHVDASIALYEELLAVEPVNTKRYQNLVRALGIAYLRQAEVKNCIARHDAECCIFPLEGRGLHSDKEPARKALEKFEWFLQRKPKHLPTVWLANLAAMALGEHPDALAEGQSIPADAFASEYELARFVDVAPRLGVDTFNLCGGVAVEDFDGDGLLDILTSTYDPEGPLTFYRNQGDGSFADRSDESHASDQLGGLNLVAADYDGDGDPDVLVLRGAWLTRDGKVRNSLLRNDGGSFVDVTRAVGLAEPARPTQAAAWGDLDGDGDLDLLVCNESSVDEDPEQDFPAQLFRNEGNGTFTDVALEAGVTNDRYAKGVALGDYDNDGDLDVYVSNFGPNRLYRNDGGLRFIDVAEELGVVEPVDRSFAAWFFDYNNDGWLDLFVTSYEGGTADLVADALELRRPRPQPRLYRNVGGSFEEVGEWVGLDRFFLPMGANFGDLDGDGWLDIYLTTGDPLLESIMPNVMLRNDRGVNFQDVTTSGGFGHLQKGHGVAFGDLDNDGDQDVYHQLGGFYAGDRFHNALFLNPGHENRTLYLELFGQGGNRDAIGARIRVYLETPRGERVVHRAVGSVSSFGGSPRRQEIGLGDATAIDRVEITWPGERTASVFRDVPLDSTFRAVEGEDALERVELERLTF